MLVRASWCVAVADAEFFERGVEDVRAVRRRVHPLIDGFFRRCMAARDVLREEAEKEKAEIAVIERFLPKQMSPEEMEAAIKALIAETNASSMKDMGKIMGALKTKYAGQMDMGKANGLIKTLLS